MRNPSEVAEKIKETIPLHEKEMREAIDWCIRDFSYKAPELARDCFSTLTNVVNDELLESHHKQGSPLTDWQVKAVSILMDETEDRIRKMEKEYASKTV